MTSMFPPYNGRRIDKTRKVETKKKGKLERERSDCLSRRHSTFRQAMMQSSSIRYVMGPFYCGSESAELVNCED